MAVNDEMIQGFKDIAKKKGQELSDAEASDQASKLVGLFELLFRHAQEDARKKNRLKKEPDGFPVDGSYSCMVCENSINPETGWYHWDGPRCLICHKAILSGVIPTFVLKNRDSYFKEWRLADAFKVRTVTIRKMVREGKLKAREILNENGKVHEYIFLKKENPDLIERHSPERKSWDRNRKKVADKWGREAKEKFKADILKIRKKSQKIRTRN